MFCFDVGFCSAHLNNFCRAPSYHSKASKNFEDAKDRDLRRDGAVCGDCVALAAIAINLV